MKKIFLYLTIAIIPTIQTILLIHFIFGSNLSRFVPARWNDQTDYWFEAFSFSKAGFNTGYFAVNENTAQAPFSHFGIHGPFYAILFGSIGRFVGWQFNTGIYINFITIALGLLFYLKIVKPNLTQQILLLAMLITSWSLLMYLPTTSQEAMHQAAACILSSIFYYLLSNEKNISPRYKIFPIIFLLFISLIRVSWAILFLPLLLFILPKSWLGKITSVILSGLIILLLIKLFDWITPPGFNSIVKVISGFNVSIIEGVNRSKILIMDNLKFISDEPLAISFLILCIAIFLVLFLLGCLLLQTQNKIKFCSNIPKIEISFHLFNLLPICLSVFSIYSVGGAGRVVGAHLFLSVLLLIALKRYRIVILLLTISIVFTPYFLKNYSRKTHRGWKENFTVHSPQEFIFWREKISGVMQYQFNAPNPWCNTVLMPLSFLDHRTLIIPGGLGIAYYVPEMSIDMPLKSHYLYFDQQTLEALKQRGLLNLIPITKVPYGVVYQNLDSVCKVDTTTKHQRSLVKEK